MQTINVRLLAIRTFGRILRRRHIKNGVYYINGPDVLPRPLSREEEAEAVADLEAGGEAAQAARTLLIEHNLRLVAFIARRYENSGVGIEDLISIGTPGLIKAVSTFHADRGIKLATYASRCIENEILMYLRKIGGRQEVSIDEPLNTDWDGNELLLSDVLGNDEHSIVEELEEADERRALHRAIAALRALRTAGADPKGGCRQAGHFAILHLSPGKADSRQATGTNGGYVTLFPRFFIKS